MHDTDHGRPAGQPRLADAPEPAAPTPPATAPEAGAPATLGPAISPASVRMAAARAATALADQEARVGEAMALLDDAQASSLVLVDRIAGTARGLAAAGGVAIPVRETVGPAPAEHPAVIEAEQIVRNRARDLARRGRRRGRPGVRVECAVVGVLSFAAFVAVGLLMVRGGVLPGDALSRVVNAQAAVAGRDPHLEAIGFVWGPFPTLFQVPFAGLRSWWPALTASGVAAVIVSAGFMAGTLVQLVLWGRDGGAPRWVRIAVVALTALHPLVWLYGGNGMSEACGLFFLVLAARHLSRWMETDDVGGLMLAGLGLGLAYLVRYEAVAAMLAVAAVVASVAWRRSADRAESTTRDRVRAVTVDVAVFGFPAAAAVVGWALVSWVIVGEPFAQFSSEYGNSALVRAAGDGIAGIIGDLSTPGRAAFFLRQAGTAVPALVLVVLLGLWMGGRVAARTTAALAVLGAPVLVQFALALQGSTFPWFRYVSAAVVLGALVVLATCGNSAWITGRHWVRPLAVLALVPGIVLSTGVVRSGALGAEDDRTSFRALGTALSGDRVVESRSRLARGERVARDIDRRRRVTPGAILTDTSSTFAVVAAAPRPEVYVIPPDRDFDAIVADPATFGIRFILLRGPATPGDAIVRLHPRLWPDDGAPIADLVQTWGREGDPAGQYRLYAVDDPASRTRPTPEDGFTP